jgi:hypothetical protein
VIIALFNLDFRARSVRTIFFLPVVITSGPVYAADLPGRHRGAERGNRSRF